MKKCRNRSNKYGNFERSLRSFLKYRILYHHRNTFKGNFCIMSVSNTTNNYNS